MDGKLGIGAEEEFFVVDPATEAMAADEGVRISGDPREAAADAALGRVAAGMAPVIARRRGW